MSDSEHDSRVGRVTEEIRRVIAEGGTPDARTLAKQFSLHWTEVERCAKAVRAMGAVAPPADAESPDAELPPPPLPDDYELLGELGRGGMAVVYRARQKSLGRIVAVKVLRPGDLVFGAMQKRFLMEARSLARLRHPHIVCVHEVGEAGGNVFFSMDLVDGESLADVIRSGRMTPTRAVKILRQVASAITYSHANGLVHRDLKPGNILLDRSGDAFVVDFGLARDMAVKGDMTGTGQLLGTPAYMSPEQARGDTGRIGEPTDVYALGAVLYECLTGRQPFTGDSLISTIRAVVQDEPVAPRKIDKKVPPDLEVICLKAMAKEPERRYANAQALLEDLERFAEGREIRARPPSSIWKAKRFVLRHWVPLAASVATAAAAAALVVFVVAPRLTSDPVDVLATATAWDAKGDHEHAAALAEETLDRRGWGGLLVRAGGEPVDPTAVGLRTRWAWAKQAIAWDLFTQGKFAEAEDLATKTAEKVRETIPNTSEQPGIWTDLHWIAARARLGRGDVAGARAAIDDIARLHTPYIWLEPVRRLNDSSQAMLDPSDAWHRGGVLSGAMTLAEAEDCFYMPEWWVARGAAGTSAAVEMLRVLPEVASVTVDDATKDRAPRLYRKVAALLEETALHRRDEVTTALAALAADAAAPPVSRACATELLVAFDDLPLWRDAASSPPEFDEAWTARALALRAELAALPRTAAETRRVEIAKADEARASAWLAGHSNVPSGLPALELLKTLVETAGATDAADAARLRLHLALTEAVPDPLRAPAWGYGHPRCGEAGLREPQRLVKAWRELIEPPPVEGAAAKTEPPVPAGLPVRVRVATFVLPSLAAPRELWTESREMRTGETWHVKDDSPLPAEALLCPIDEPFTPHFPGPDPHAWDFRGPIRPSHVFESDLSVEGRRLAFGHVVADVRPVARRFGTSSWMSGFIDGCSLGESLWAGVWIWQRQDMDDPDVHRHEPYAGVVATFATIDDGPADARWTWDDWRLAVPKGALAAMWAVPKEEEWGWRASLDWHAPAAILVLFAFAAAGLVRALRRSRGDRRRLVPAALAVAAGVPAASIGHIGFGSTDWHAEWLYLAVVAGGAWVLADEAAVRRRAAFAVPSLLAASVVLSAAGWAADAIVVTWIARGASLAGLAGLWFLAGAVGPPRTNLGRAVFRLLGLVAPAMAAYGLVSRHENFVRTYYGPLDSGVFFLWLLAVLVALVLAARRAARAPQPA